MSCDMEARRRVQKRRKEPKVRRNSLFSQTPFPLPTSTKFCTRGPFSDIFLGFEFQKDRLKMWELWGLKFWSSHRQATSLVEQLVATAQAVVQFVLSVA